MKQEFHSSHAMSTSDLWFLRLLLVSLTYTVFPSFHVIHPLHCMVIGIFLTYVHYLWLGLRGDFCGILCYLIHQISRGKELWWGFKQNDALDYLSCKEVHNVKPVICFSIYIEPRTLVCTAGLKATFNKNGLMPQFLFLIISHWAVPNASKLRSNSTHPTLFIFS